MSLRSLKEKLATIKPFVIYNFFGNKNCLAIPNPDIDTEPDIPLLPLSVSTHPPSMTHLIESEQVTTLILRYTDSFAKAAEETKTELEKGELVKQAIQDMSSKIMTSEIERVKQIKLMTELGRAFLISQSIEAWYGDYTKAEKFAIEFTETQEQAAERNAEILDDDSKLFICVDNINEMEYFKISMELSSAIPTDQIPNIPIVDETGVIAESVPADKLAKFPRDTRSLTVEDVRPDDSETDRDNSPDPTTRSNAGGL